MRVGMSECRGYCRLDTEFGSLMPLWFAPESPGEGGGGVRINSETGSSISQVPDRKADPGEWLQIERPMEDGNMRGIEERDWEIAVHYIFRPCSC